MSEEINKPRQFWISEKCSHGNYFHTVDFAENGWENAIHVIELEPMLKMMESMAKVFEGLKSLVDTDYVQSITEDEEVEFWVNDNDVQINCDDILESYEAFKRENGLE